MAQADRHLDHTADKPIPGIFTKDVGPEVKEAYIADDGLVSVDMRMEYPEDFMPPESGEPAYKWKQAIFYKLDNKDERWR